MKEKHAKEYASKWRNEDLSTFYFIAGCARKNKRDKACHLAD